jgi:two-component system, OmpR family, sensor histidine kinase KdpD
MRHSWYVRALSSQKRHSQALCGSIAALAVVTGAVYLFREAVPVLSLGVLYLFAVLPVAVVWGRAYAILVAVASMLAFNFFFLPPKHTFRLEDTENWFALAVYLVTGIVVSELAARARHRAGEAEQREREEALLAELSIALLQGEQLTAGLDRIAEAAARVLGVERARLELTAEAEPAFGEKVLALDVGARRVGTLWMSAGSQPDPSISSRFLPALASLLAVAIDREELEREALAAERLRLSDSVKTAILRAVSHDLRSPLTAIRVAAESLASSALRLSEADRRRQLDTVREESRRLDRLVANLLDISRLQTGAASPRRELVGVDELVGQALTELARDDPSVKIELPADIPFVEVDAVQVERVLVNLIENARRFSPVDENVIVRVTTSPIEAIVSVDDRGPGIEERDLERIFEPFERVTDGDERRGTGLGLAIARGFAEANGGRIWAESRPGRGSTFMLAFPVAPAPIRGET